MVAHKRDKMILEIKNLVKTFPGVKALHKVNFQLEAGEIHALVGGHGAGKSVLIKVLSGVYARDSGTINYFGKYFEVSSPREAEHSGICPVFQEVNLIHNLTVAENLFMEKQPKTLGFINWKQINKHASEVLKQFELDIDVTRELGELSIAAQQMVVIGRALIGEPKILILDEPTSSLNQEEAELLFKQLRRLKSEGVAIIFITHFLEQVYSICDKITVLKNGENAGTWLVDELPKSKLDEMLAVKKIEESYQDDVQERIQPSVDGYELEFNNDEQYDFAEILDSGNIESVDVKLNITQKDGTQSAVNRQCAVVKNPILKLSSMYNSESKSKEDVTGELSVMENIALALGVKRGWFSLLQEEEQKRYVEEYIKIFGILPSCLDEKVNKLVDEDRQKIAFARGLASNPAIVMIDEPTRGVDLQDKKESQKYIIKLSNSRVCVVFISPELTELINNSGGAVIMH